MLLAERIRKSIEGLRIPWENDTLQVTVSIGVATHGPTTPSVDPKGLFARADQALYRAKSAGRNAVRD
jgi:diguanylate cyclase (GGDEF)-like protein